MECDPAAALEAGGCYVMEDRAGVIQSGVGAAALHAPATPPRSNDLKILNGRKETLRKFVGNSIVRRYSHASIRFEIIDR